jgi:outer membrane receptor protein involved in Fe transport
MSFTKCRTFSAAAVLFSFLVLRLAPSGAWAATAAVTGRVTSSDGAPIADAVVTLRGSAGERSARTDARGTFVLEAIDDGSYAIRVSAAGYDALGGETIGVRDRASFVTLTMQRSSSSLVTIGRVTTNGGDALSTSSAPATTIDAQDYAERGYMRVSDVLQNDVSTTLVHPLGGSSLLPTSVALRGPDPTETLVDIDGHQVNNGNTGDFDLSLLDPADYGSIELVKGISPSSLVGPDTIDGAINIRTLDPTALPHGFVRIVVGSFGSFAETLQSTGTIDRFGYALSLHRTTSDGEVGGAIRDATSGTTAQVGSAFASSTALGRLRYAFGSRGDAYVELSFRDQSQFRDLSAALSSIPSPGDPNGDTTTGDGTSPQVLDGFEGTTLAAHNAGYGLDLRLPIGALDASGAARTSALIRHETSYVSESVTGPGADTSSYLYNDRDAIADDSIELDHRFDRSALTLQIALRNENLRTDFLSGVVNDESYVRASGALADVAMRRLPIDADDSSDAAVAQLGLGQTQRSIVLRYAYDPTATLHLTAAAYDSDYSSFGKSLDPRFGLTYDPDARSVLRFSVGTTFQAPQLPELYVPPVLPQAVGGYVSVGNPNLKADRATEYGLGLERILEVGAHRTDLSADLYRVNLRAPAAVFLPQLDPTCGSTSNGGDGTACPLSYPVNAGDAVYQGIELAGSRTIAPNTTVHAGYAVRSAYLTNVPPSIANGTLVAREQSLGLPLQKGLLSIRSAPPTGIGFSAGLVYEGRYNELDQPPFALLNAGVTLRVHRFDCNVDATNITNVYDQHFTRIGAGVPYGGLAGPIATDAYALAGTAFSVSVSRRF